MPAINKFSSIDQFRQICKHLTNQARFNNTAPEIIKAYGTVKIHGSNAGYCNEAGETWLQSREQVLSNESGHFGFHIVVKENEELLKNIVKKVREVDSLDEDTCVGLYGEIAGPGVQKGVGVSNTHLFFCIFSIYVGREEKRYKWSIPKIQEHIAPMIPAPKNGVKQSLYCITQFPVHELTIDFGYPEQVQNTLSELTIAVENECPVAKAIIAEELLTPEVKLIGEGIVWTLETSKGESLAFKVKGEKHSVTKVKTLATIDPEVLKGIDNFVEYVATENRLKQGIDKLKEMGIEPDSDQAIGKYVKWFVGDCLREEQDTLLANKLRPEQVMGKLNKIASSFIIKHRSGL